MLLQQLRQVQVLSPAAHDQLLSVVYSPYCQAMEYADSC